VDPVRFSPGRAPYGSRILSARRQGAVPVLVQQGEEAISPDGVISDAGARTALKVIPTFNPEVKAKEIKLELTYTNEFVKRAMRNTAEPTR